MKISRWLNLTLSAAAMLMFALNLRAQLTGQEFNLHSEGGATALVVFLTVGVLVQLLKLLQGHDHAVELVVTVLLLAGHVVGDALIWWQTQIIGSQLPDAVPLLIVGGYWIVGVLDMTATYLPPQLALFKQGAKTPEQRLAVLEQDRAVLEQDRALLEQKVAMLEHSLSSAEQSLSNAQERYERAQEAKNKTYSIACPVDHCYWDTGEKPSKAAAERSLRTHLSKAHSTTMAEVNGNRQNVSVFEE